MMRITGYDFLKYICFPHKSIRFVLLCCIFIYLSGGIALAESLVVPAGQTVNLSGRVTYDTVDILGTLKLTGDTNIRVTCGQSQQGCNMNIPGFPTLGFHMGKTGVIVHEGAAGANGSSYTENQLGPAGGTGTDGSRAYSLSIIVYGDALLQAGAITLAGGKGGNGGNGGLGAPGGRGGRGGDGGNFTFVLNGALTVDKDGVSYITSKGGQGGTGGNGGHNGAPGAAAGEGGNGRTITIIAQQLNISSYLNSVPYLQVAAPGGNSGTTSLGSGWGGYPSLSGGSGGTPGNGSPGGNGGTINITVPCTTYLYMCGLSAPGGTGSIGGRSLDNMIPATPGGRGGKGGTISLTAKNLVNREVRLAAVGGTGGQGGRAAPGEPSIGIPFGVAGDGGQGGKGGTVLATADTIQPGVILNVTGGAGGAGGIGAVDYATGKITGPPGNPGITGLVGMASTATPPDDGFSLLMSVDHDVVLPGDQITYALTVMNTAVSQGNVVVSLPIPDNTTLVSATSGGNLIGSTMVWNLGSLSDCGLRTLVALVSVNSITPNGTFISAFGTITSSIHVVPQASNTVFTRVQSAPPPAPTIDPQSLYGSQPDDIIDPVSPATGNFTFSNALFGYVGKGVPFGFVVNYNALASATDGPLGFGWTHSYNIALSRSGNNVTISWGDGHKEFFKDIGSGVFEAFNCRPSVSLANLGQQGYEATAHAGLRYQFDGSGRLSSLIDRNGNQVTLSHSTILDSITDTAGREITFTYEGGRISQVSGPLITWMFDYDGNGDLTGITDPRGNTRNFTYDTSHRMLTEVDPRGNTVATNVYDTEGRVVSQTNAVGGQTTFGYTVGSSGITVKITPPSGNAVWQIFDSAYNLITPVDGEGGQSNFTFDGKGLPVGITDKNGKAISCYYDSNQNVTSLTNRRGQTTQFLIGAHNQPTKQINALGQASEFTYDPSGNMTAWKDTLGNQSSATFDSSGQFLSMQDPRGATWQAAYTGEGLMAHRTNPAGSTVAYGYDAAGRPVVITLPNGNTWQMTYDANGNLATQTDPLGHVVTLMYDANNNVIRRTFVPTGAVTQHVYDAMNRLVMTTDALGGLTTYAYDIEGRLVSATDPDGIATSYQYDKSGRVTVQTDTAGGVTTYGYDALGNIRSVKDPLGKTWTSAFNEENQVVQSTDPLGHSNNYTYDELGRVRTITDKLGNVTTSSYDAESRLVKVTHPDGSAAAYQYDANGNMTRVTDGLNHAWQFAFDAVNRLTAATDPAGRQETFQYDAFNRVTRKVTRKGEIITYAYNAAGGLASVTLPGPTPITYGYDAAGNLTAITDPSGTTSMTYDLLGRRLTRTDPNGKTLAFSYTAAGRLQMIRYPGSNDVTYAYDTAGRLATITDWLGHQTLFQYDIASRPTRIDLPNGTRKIFTYDDRGLVATLTEEKSDASTIAGYSFLRNAGGRITGETRNEAVTGSFSPSLSTYTYDAANRVLTGVNNGISTAYAFDFNGNLTSRTSGGITTAYTYDTLNRLIQVSDSANTTAYTYDGSGNRLAKTYNGAKTQYLREGGQVFCTLDGAGSVKSYNIFAGVLLYSLDAAGTMAVYHDDVRGSVTAITDAAQGIVRAYAYDPYGNVIGSSGALAGDVRFVGTHGVLADENGLYHMQARYYDPEAKRFITEDPIGLSGGLNLYGYVGGDPVNAIDPSGLSPDSTSLEAYGNDAWQRELNKLLNTGKSMDEAVEAAEKARESALKWGPQLGYKPAAQMPKASIPSYQRGSSVISKSTATSDDFLEAVAKRRAEFAGKGWTNYNAPSGYYTQGTLPKNIMLPNTVERGIVPVSNDFARDEAPSAGRGLANRILTGAEGAESTPNVLSRVVNWGRNTIQRAAEHPVGRGVVRYGTAVMENPVAKGIIRVGGKVLVVYAVVDTGVRSYAYGREHASTDLYYDNISGRWVTFDQYYTEGYLPIFQWYYQVDPMDQLNPSAYYKYKLRREHPELFERLKK